MTCYRFQEHKDWAQKHPTGPVTWDGWCSVCGFQLTDKPLLAGTIIDGGGRKLFQVCRMLGAFRSTISEIVCSVCCPTALLTEANLK